MRYGATILKIAALCGKYNVRMPKSFVRFVSRIMCSEEYFVGVSIEDLSNCAVGILGAAQKHVGACVKRIEACRSPKDLQAVLKRYEYVFNIASIVRRGQLSEREIDLCGTVLNDTSDRVVKALIPKVIEIHNNYGYLDDDPESLWHNLICDLQFTASEATEHTSHGNVRSFNLHQVDMSLIEGDSLQECYDECMLCLFRAQKRFAAAAAFGGNVRVGDTRVLSCFEKCVSGKIDNILPSAVADMVSVGSVVYVDGRIRGTGSFLGFGAYGQQNINKKSKGSPTHKERSRRRINKEYWSRMGFVDSSSDESAYEYESDRDEKISKYTKGGYDSDGTQSELEDEWDEADDLHLRREKQRDLHWSRLSRAHDDMSSEVSDGDFADYGDIEDNLDDWNWNSRDDGFNGPGGFTEKDRVLSSEAVRMDLDLPSVANPSLLAPTQDDEVADLSIPISSTPSQSTSSPSPATPPPPPAVPSPPAAPPPPPAAPAPPPMPPPQIGNGLQINKDKAAESKKMVEANVKQKALMNELEDKLSKIRGDVGTKEGQNKNLEESLSNKQKDANANSAITDGPKKEVSVGILNMLQKLQDRDSSRSDDDDDSLSASSAESAVSENTTSSHPLSTAPPAIPSPPAAPPPPPAAPVPPPIPPPRTGNGLKIVRSDKSKRLLEQNPKNLKGAVDVMNELRKALAVRTKTVEEKSAFDENHDDDKSNKMDAESPAKLKEEDKQEDPATKHKESPAATKSDIDTTVEHGSAEEEAQVTEPKTQNFTSSSASKAGEDKDIGPSSSK